MYIYLCEMMKVLKEASDFSLEPKLQVGYRRCPKWILGIQVLWESSTRSFKPIVYVWVLSLLKHHVYLGAQRPECGLEDQETELSMAVTRHIGGDKWTGSSAGATSAPNC